MSDNETARTKNVRAVIVQTVDFFTLFCNTYIARKRPAACSCSICIKDLIRKKEISIMGLFDEEDVELDALLDAVKKYPSYVTELTEGIVQEVFNRCLATNDTPKENISLSMLFSVPFGYKPEEEKIVVFDKNLTKKQASSIYLVN